MKPIAIIIPCTLVWLLAALCVGLVFGLLCWPATLTYLLVKRRAAGWLDSTGR